MQVTLVDKINRIYLSSINKDELLGAYNEICASYLNNPAVIGFLKHKPELASEYGIHEALSLRVLAKHLLLRYLERYSEEDKAFCSERIKSALSLSIEKKYLKTSKLLASVRDFIDSVHEIMREAVGAVNRIRDGFGNIATDNVAVIKESADMIEKALSHARELDASDMFAQNVTVPDFVGGIVKDLEQEVEWFSRALKEHSSVHAQKLLDELSAPIESLGVITKARFYESPLDSAKTNAHTVVISTPFEEEAILFAGVYSSMTAAPFHVFRADKITAENARTVPMDELFGTAARRGTSLLILGIDKVDESVAEIMKEAILRTSKGGVYFLVHDGIGTRALYESFDKIALNALGLSSLDVHHVFLTMPNFNETCKLLSENSYITDTEQDRETVKKRIPFIGYVGLNAILGSSETSDWLAAASERSNENSGAAIAYLNRLIAPRQLIDEGWGNFSGHVRFVKGERKAFDYDEIHGLDRENVRLIMEKPGLTTFDRCGMVVKYCLLSGNDSSVWSTLSVEEKESRAALATRMVCKILATLYTPEVKIVPEELWERGSAGGICQDGGKSIVYRESAVNSYSWMESAVCHECFHAFQHTACDVPYSDWFFTELGVTEGRITYWDDNFKVYVGSENSKIYRVEVVECDANAFALDCLRNVEKYWKDIDFN